jgi:transcriptional regulator NrdR family protein
MKCPQCGAWSDVKDSRQGRRRRECANGHRFTTQEIIIDEKLHLEKIERMNRARKYPKKNPS